MWLKKAPLKQLETIIKLVVFFLILQLATKHLPAA